MRIIRAIPAGASMHALPCSSSSNTYMSELPEECTLAVVAAKSAMQRKVLAHLRVPGCRRQRKHHPAPS